MNHIIKILIIAVNILVYYSVSTEDKLNIILYLFIFNALSFAVFYVLDPKNVLNLIDGKHIFDNPKKSVIQEISKSLNNLLTWVVFLFPSVLAFFIEYEKIDVIQVLFFMVMLVNIWLNIIALSVIVRLFYHRLYSIYIASILVITQVFIFFNELTVEKIFLLGSFLILLSYISIFGLYFKKKQKIAH